MASNESANANVVLTADVSNYTQSINEAESSTQKLIKGVSTLSSAISGVRKAAAQRLVIFAAADVAGLAAGVAIAAKFEQQLKTLSGVTAAASKNQGQFNASMATYRDGINKIARDSSTSRGEIAQLTTSLTQMGVKGPAEVVKVAKTMDQLSKATGESATAMAASLTQFAQQMGTLGNGSASLQKYSDSLVAVSSQAGVAASSVASFAQSIAPVARAAGVSATEVIGFSAAFSKAGADGFAAANTFNSILSEITRGVQSGSPDMAKYANLIGVTAGEFEKMNKSQAIIQIFEAINSAGPKSLQILDQLGIDGVRAQRAIQAVAASGDLNNILATATGDNSGITGKAADAAENNLGSALSRVQNQFEQIGSTIGEMWIGPLTKVVQLFGEMLSKVQPILDPILKIGSVIAGLAAPMAAVAAALLSIAPIITPLALAITAMSGLRALSAGFRGGAGDIRPGDKFQERYANNQMGPVQRALYNTAAGAGGIANRMGYTPMSAGGGGLGGMIRGAAAYGFQGAGAYFRMTGDLYDRARIDGTDSTKSMGSNLSNAGTALKNMFTSTDGFRKGLDDARTKLSAGIGPAPALGTAMKGAISDFGKMSWAATRMVAAAGSSGVVAGAGAAGSGLMKLGGGLVGALGGPVGIGLMGGVMGGMAIAKAQGDVDKNNETNRAVAKEFFSQFGEYAKSLDIATTEVNGFAAAIKKASSSISVDDATKGITQEDVVAANTPGREITSNIVKTGGKDAVMAWMKTLDPSIDPKMFDALRVDLVQQYGAVEANSMLSEYRDSREIGKKDLYTLSQSSRDSTVSDITGVESDTFKTLGYSAGRKADSSIQFGPFSKAGSQDEIQKLLSTAMGTGAVSAAKIADYSGNTQASNKFSAGVLNELLGSVLKGARAEAESYGASYKEIAPEDILQSYLNTLVTNIPQFSQNKFTQDDLGTPGDQGVMGSGPTSRTFDNNISTEEYAANFWTQFYDKGDKATKRYIDEDLGGVKTLIAAKIDPNAEVAGRVSPQIAALNASALGNFAVNSPVIGNALTRLNDPKANAAAIAELVDKSNEFGGNLNTSIDALQQFKNVIGDSSSRLYQLADAAQKQLLFYRDFDRGFMSYGDKVDDTNVTYRNLQKALETSNGNQAMYAKAVQAFTDNPRQGTLNNLNNNAKYAGSTGQVSDTIERMNQMSTGEITTLIGDTISMINGIGIQRRNMNLQQSYQQEDFNRQKEQSEFNFNLSLERQNDNFRRNELRSIASYNRQRKYSEEDYQRQRKESLQDHNRDVRNMVSQQMQTIYNPYQTVQAQGGMSKTMLFSNLREQTRLLKDQRKNLNLFKKLFPSEAAARNAIDMLDLTNPANAGQLDELVRTMSSQDAASLTQIYGQRRKATADLVANEDNFGFRTQEEAFRLSLKRQEANFERMMTRQEKEFNRSLKQSNEDFNRNVRQSKADFQRNADWAVEAFGISMVRAETAFNQSITDMLTPTGQLQTGLETIATLVPTVITDIKTLMTLGKDADVQSSYIGKMSKLLEGIEGRTTATVVMRTDDQTDQTLAKVNSVWGAIQRINGTTATFTIKPLSSNTENPGDPEKDRIHGGAGRVVIQSAAGSGDVQFIEIRNLNIGKRWGGKVGHPYDTVPVMAQKGEWFHRAESASYYGDDVMSGINDMRINRSALKQAMQGNYASTVAYKGTDNGSVTNINASTNFNGQITVQAQDPNEMSRKLASKQRMAALTRRK
jgi:TP901 family phage tail tape measure protein